MCVQLSCVSTCVTSPSIIHAYLLSPPPFSCGYLPPPPPPCLWWRDSFFGRYGKGKKVGRLFGGTRGLLRSWQVSSLLNLLGIVVTSMFLDIFKKILGWTKDNSPWFFAKNTFPGFFHMYTVILCVDMLEQNYPAYKKGVSLRYSCLDSTWFLEKR